MEGEGPTLKLSQVFVNLTIIKEYIIHTNITINFSRRPIFPNIKLFQ